MLFDGHGALFARADCPHAQIVNAQGWVEHDGEEIYRNMIAAVRAVLAQSGVPESAVAAAAISNQRETGILFTRRGVPVYNAVVWQCARGAALCAAIEAEGLAAEIKAKTGLRLSPYFTAAKFGWLMQNIPAAQDALARGDLLAGTMDTWLLYRLTGRHCTDYSNASRTQLFNIHTLAWDARLCEIFGVPMETLPTVCMSDSDFGSTTFEGIFALPIPLHAVLGDSHAALFAQGCTAPGLGKATYGTGSSVMLHTGDTAVESEGLVTSLAWGLSGRVDYVLEGNINYAGAVLNWLRDDLQLIASEKEAEPLARKAKNNGGVYLVPAFSGLGAPHWDSEARALLCGMSRGTKKEHVVRAAEESIAYQITDVVRAAACAGVTPAQLFADGGPTRDGFLMQFQADMLRLPVVVCRTQELSGAGAAFAAGLATGFYTEETIASARSVVSYNPIMPSAEADALYAGWQKAVALVL